MDTIDNATLLKIYLWLSVGILATFLPFELILLQRIRWRIEATSIVILVSFSLCFAVRVTTNALCLNPDSCDTTILLGDKFVVALKIISSIADRLKWLVVYFCVLEMQEVRIKIESDTLQEYQKKIKVLKIIKTVIVSVFVIVQFPIIFIHYFGDDLLSMLKEYNITDDNLTIILHIIRLPIDVYIFFIYMRLINYMVVMKKIKLKANLMRFTCFNYMIIALAFFIGILSLF